ncbi:MAG: transcription-repair coupling factor [Chloroflexi bacterium]|nr:transcription-repair coupling factor [Chloroflexota bacterium]
MGTAHGPTAPGEGILAPTDEHGLDDEQPGSPSGASIRPLDLSALLPTLRRHPAFEDLTQALTGAPCDEPHRLSVADPAKPYALAALHAALGRSLVLLTARPGHARQLWEDLTAWSPVEVLHFPAPDALPYERLPEDPDITARRVDVLTRLAEAEGSAAAVRPLVVLSLRAAMDLLEAPERFRAASRVLRVGDEVSMSGLIEAWVAGGYASEPLVDAPGQFSRRGGILDVYPPSGPPARIEFFGDEIESIRVFDLETQRSGERLQALRVPPARERPAEPLDGIVAPGGDGATNRSPTTVERSATFFDHLPADTIIALDEPSQIEMVGRDLEQQAEEVRAHHLERGDLPPDTQRPYLPWPQLRARLGASGRPLLDMTHDPGKEWLPFTHAPAFAGRLRSLLDRIARPAARGDESVVVVSQQAARLQELLAERNVEVMPSVHLPDAWRQPPADGQGRLALVHGSLPEGWHCDPLGLTVYTDGELFGWRKVRRPLRRSRTAAREAFLSDLEPGELVVHVDHGIGRFRGLYRTGANDGPNGSTGAVREFLLIDYEGGDHLYVPSEQADRVTRYVGGGDEAPGLTKLGTQEWSRAKARARRAVRDIARDLIDLYAARKLAQGHAFGADTTWQRELEDSFPYIETPDQLIAIADVKQDMERPEPMDRLLVGDVGYGKTEVALRAAFKAVMDGRQVAVLVPTTVLAQQHYATFKERFGTFPVHVEVLSRFRSEKEQKAVVAATAAGSVDIVVGTHRLLSKDVRFKNLGLVIVDEEQRFGVVHKERLKQLRREVDVLTLTATPIPRTLHMSLAGVRDMSVMETAPEERLPIRSYVAEFDEGLVREAILRELDRGGQVYFVHNRVQSIEIVLRHLRELVPEARFIVGHGQMHEERLERVMLQFANGEADVLLCTTIIESGLDIPNANTIIVDNAHRFGLAQLYQLRGRVGRGPVRAYAYFLFARDTQLNEQAEQRLRTIFEATELGAGFRIAMKDLEIRGAGNLLGAEQSGQIAAVGFDLYTRLLAEAVDLMRAAQEGSPLPIADAAGPDQRPSLDLPLDAFLPAEYVADEAARLNLYQRFATVATGEALGELLSELEDRFGALPETAQNLVYLVGMRLEAQRRGVSQVTATDREIVVKLRGRPPTDLARLGREVGVPLRGGSNQIGLPRGKGESWIVTLQRLVDVLPVT